MEPCTTARPDDIIYAIEVLDEKVAGVDRRIGYLADKLAPILRGNPTVPKPENQKCFSDDTSPIYRMIANQSATLYEIANQLDALIERIDLEGK